MPVMNRKPVGQSREESLRSAAAAAVGAEKHGQASLPLSPLFGMCAHAGFAEWSLSRPLSKCFLVVCSDIRNSIPPRCRQARYTRPK